ncbi:hypothetical protein, partial [Dialister invisus]|uniref:hypothetical protein n=1 Tax=Dialister invisus TaxID=218538 RepID=UPI003AB5110C
LLNNWENTGFDFNQQSLAELMKDAKDLGWNLKGKFCVFQAEKSEVMKAGHNFFGCILYK